MAKEFDIYLRNHLTECDLIVYSIPYHDGISVTNRLILEAALNSYAFHKFAAVHMQSKLTAHIDNMIKLCLEKLNMKTELGASVGFNVQNKLYVQNSPVVIDTPSIKTFCRTMNDVESNLALAIAPLVTQAATSTGEGHFKFSVGTSITDTLKHSLLSLHGPISPSISVSNINQTDFITADTSTITDSTLQSLCYNLIFDASAAFEIVSLVLGTEIRHSLGMWYNGITLNSKVTGTWSQKFIAAETVTAVMQDAIGSLVKIMYPDDSATSITVGNVNAGLKRYRVLSEVDNVPLSTYDDMRLYDVDYVILQE